MNQEAVFQLLVSHAREVVPHLAQHPFQPSESFKTLGANSMDRADILMMTMEALSIRCSLTELAGPANIGELAALLAQKARHG
ncbi:acyl carrier protein [Burkholderia thailandensis]|uniref:Polyketide biosynthesis acyl-carrier-protein AcpK n=3 Tax=Burkholderia thailandensis TaxID=57975 RepID=A0AAW9CS90_BURTH|nr:acyl carrier protein [Burkholderia thailandensis]ABC35804.1 acyl carier protein-related protein [Burkholderia thailandensis E264]AHI67182.1 polyketide biosynthesis acyl-carrier-protein AcpK [Burkholderia thailandensis H0587]AHI77233.1 polyketide biosynthesis acyl-carrier-protein AcpK [Burkholderia thailandensis 2002721723]AHI82265.1 polyketide biosynthesis acyl-carrier-protein AcpK [Burkholderia thailandensis E444]AIC91203.1 polyketide biosynthesis acyl-carrier-protein AcpK [Burkholderia th